MTRDFNWGPGIGDPTIGGWVTVVLYLLACVSCWKTAGVVLRRDWNGQSDSHVWRAISIAFFFLGINKQLDLQSAITELGRTVAFAGGWYEQRETVQVYFVKRRRFGASLTTSVTGLRRWGCRDLFDQYPTGQRTRCPAGQLPVPTE